MRDCWITKRPDTSLRLRLAAALPLGLFLCSLASTRASKIASHQAAIVPRGSCQAGDSRSLACYGEATGKMLKVVKTVLPRPHPHWVGDGFHVYPGTRLLQHCC